MDHHLTFTQQTRVCVLYETFIFIFIHQYKNLKAAYLVWLQKLPRHLREVDDPVYLCI